MSQQNRINDLASEQRANLLRQAEAQGVRPLKFDELLGPPSGLDNKAEIDDFLALRRQWREEELARSRR